MRKLPFFDDFQYIDPSITPRVIKVEKNAYEINVYVSNLIPTTGRLYNVIKTFFNKQKVKYIFDQNTQSLKISLPRVLVTKSGYSLKDILSFLNLTSNTNWLLGINDFGPVNFEISKLTHAIVVGGSGYGKSSFFKYLLSQTLANHDNIVNFIIDPKMVDYSLFESHPNVGLVADTKEKWMNLLYLLIVELEVRKEIFSKSFKRSPNNLNDYLKYRDENKRTDLPDFKRFIIWIDEYHVLNNQNSYAAVETERETLAYIARLGRAFGIHLVGSSQNYSDFPSDVKNQASTIFAFYTNQVIMGDHNGLNQEFAIPGRMNFAFGKEVTENIQTPIVSDEECLAYAFVGKEISKTKTSPFYTLNLLETDDYGKDYVSSLVQGNGLYKKSLKRTSVGQKVSDHIFRSYHNIKKGNPENPEEKDKILNDIESIFSKNEPLRSSITKIDDNVLEGLKIQLTDNSLKKITLNLTSNNDLSLSWCLIDDEKNYGLNLCYKNMLVSESSDENEGPVVSVTKLALSYQNKQTILKYLDELDIAIKGKKSSPVLIIKGAPGTGKRTILKSIAKEVGIKFREAKSDDFLIHPTSEESDEIIVFDSVKQVKSFYKNGHPDLHPIVFIETAQGKDRNVSELAEIKYLDKYYFFLDLDTENYQNEKVLDELLQSLYERFNYDFDSGFLSGATLSLKGVPFNPEKIAALISRASDRCKHLGKRLNYNELLEEINRFESFKELDGHKAVKVIKPRYKMNDLILDEKNKENLQDIILAAKNVSKKKYKFHEKLRGSSRIIALFHGASGSGKSMSAEVLAGELGKELWMISFADLQSCYVGETEQILSNLFERASLAKQVLLFDECEVFLGNRDEKGSSEYMSRIVNHILNLFEQFSGILILTTNYSEDIDKAFMRRIDFKIEYPLPTIEMMNKILESILLPDAPLEGKLDGDALFFSRDITVTGDMEAMLALRNALDDCNVDLPADLSKATGPFAPLVQNIAGYVRDKALNVKAPDHGERTWN